MVTIDQQNEMLGCAVCRKPFSPTQLTAVSNKRWDFSEAVVVCPDCLQQKRAELKAAPKRSDLAMSAIWSLIAFLITTFSVCLFIWNQIGGDGFLLFDTFWSYLGAYGLVVTGLIIGKAAYYGSGRKESLVQRLAAVGFTLLSLLITIYIDRVAYLNFALDVGRPSGHPLAYIDPYAFLTGTLIQSVIDLFFQSQGHIGLAIVAGTAAGLGVAYYSSGGPKLYTRPFQEGLKG